MRICRISAKNFRTLECCDISLPEYFTAVSGKNNAGKSNLLRVIRAFFVNDDEFDPFAGEAQSISYKQDYPVWKKKDEQRQDIELALEITIHRARDAGLFKYVQQWLSKDCQDEELHLTLGVRLSEASPQAPVYSLKYQTEEISDPFKVEEVHKKLKTSSSFLYHNSTQPRHRYFAGQ